MSAEFIPKEKLSELNSLVERMRSLLVVNDITLLQGKQIMEASNDLFKEIKRIARAFISAKKRDAAEYEGIIQKISSEYNSSKEIITKRINVYYDFLRETAPRHVEEISNLVVESTKMIEEEYADQLRADSIKIVRERKEGVRVVGFKVEDMVSVCQSVVLGEISQNVVLINENFLLDIGRRYKYKVNIPGIRWVWKNKKGEVLDELRP